MKISPVQGLPTIPNPGATGLSPEKLERLKSIARGQTPTEATDEVVPQRQPNATRSIKMSVNRTPEHAEVPETTQDVGVSDTDVQATPAPEAIQPISPQLAALAKQRRALQLERQKFEDEKKALQTTGQTRAELEARIKSQPLSVLQELGVTYDQLTNEILGKQANGDIDALNSKITSLEKSFDEKLAAKDSQQEQAVFEHMKRNVDKLAFSSDEYKFIRESKSQDLVMSAIRKAWKGDENDPENFPGGEVLDEEEAMKLIETQLRDDARRYAKLIGELEPTTPVAAQTALPGFKTLTNKDSARPLLTPRQRAIAAFKGQTK